MKNKYYEYFVQEEEYALGKHKKNIIKKRISYNKYSLPKEWYNLNEQEFWGFMVLPNVFLRMKTIGLWQKGNEFLSSFFNDKYFYLEKKQGEFICKMTNIIALLADGTVTNCCIDYEGENNLGNIENSSIASIINSNYRNILIKNASLSKLCRQCRGSLFLFDKSPLKKKKQSVLYSNSFYPYEHDLYNKGGRWTSANSIAYIYTRLKSKSVNIFFYSIYENNVLFNLNIYLYNEEEKNFSLIYNNTFNGKKEDINNVSFSYNFEYNKFYKFEIITPTFIPSLAGINPEDNRKLGIAIFDLYIC